jgi:hypothetical protein
MIDLTDVTHGLILIPLGLICLYLLKIGLKK